MTVQAPGLAKPPSRRTAPALYVASTLECYVHQRGRLPHRVVREGMRPVAFERVSLYLYAWLYRSVADHVERMPEASDAAAVSEAFDRMHETILRVGEYDAADLDWARSMRGFHGVARYRPLPVYVVRAEPGTLVLRDGDQ